MTEPTRQPTLGERVRAAREAEMLSQTELGERLGISLRTVQRLEGGKRPREYKVRRKLERWLREVEEAA